MSDSEKVNSVYPREDLPIEWINLNDWNPNFVPTDIKNAIKDDIAQNGFLGTIIIQKHNDRMKKDNVIVNGEHRFIAFKEMGGLKIPSTIIDCDDITAQILTIRLNREHGELLPNKVGTILNNIAKHKENNLELLQRLTAINHKDLEALINLRKNDLAEVMAKDKTLANPKLIMCPHCGKEFQL